MESVPLRLVIALLLLPLCAQAVELHLQFGALERLAREQLFAEDGRRYMHGNQKAKCSFAYLEQPHIQGDAGRLRIQAKFTGRSAMNVFDNAWGSAMHSTSPSWRRLNSIAETSPSGTCQY